MTLLKAGSTQMREVTVHVPTVRATKDRPPIVEPKSVTHTNLGSNIGVLRVRYFPGALGLRFARQLDKAVEALKETGCRKLIVDLRGNIGGSLGFARLASYLCSERLPIGHSLTPSRLRAGYSIDELPRVKMPATRAEAAITLARFAVRDKSVMLTTQGLGPQPFHGKVVVMVNEWTNSAGEIVAAFAGESQLATSVGEPSHGNALGAANFKVGFGYWLRLPIFGWYTAQGRSLETAGVQPDRVCPLDPEALSAGVDSQMDLAEAVLNGQILAGRANPNDRSER
jgi:C-terminal processing protease CtpA/Prc